MKKLLLLLCCCLPGWTQAQIPDYFANDSRWVENTSSAGNQVPPYIPTSTTYLYWIAGDSVVNNLTYKKVMFRSRTTSDWANPPSFGSGFKCLLRQEGRNIWRIENLNGATEQLLVSYDYAVGDSLKGHVFEQCGYHNDTIQKVDSVYMNGEYRRLFYTDTMGGPIIIEGVGHMLDASGMGGGFMLPLCMGLGWSNSLGCYAQGSQPLWPEPSAGSLCDALSLSLEENKLAQAKVFPNPFQQYFEVETADFSEKMLFLYDISGKKLLQQSFTETVRMQADHLPAGVYWYELHAPNSPSVFGKLVKY